MIISHKQQFVFTRPMKVGSSSAQRMIVDSGVLAKGDYHSGTVEKITEDGFLDIEKSLPPKFFSSQKKRDEIFRAKMLLAHATPDVLFDHDLLTEDELNNYTFITIARNPIERYFSAWLYDGGGPKELFFEMVDKNILPMAMRFSTPQDHVSFAGTVLDNIVVIDTATLDADLKRIMSRYGGDIAEFLHLKPGKKPEWAKEHYLEWMPEETIEKLSNLLADEIAFYNKYCAGKV